MYSEKDLGVLTRAEGIPLGLSVLSFWRQKPKRMPLFQRNPFRTIVNAPNFHFIFYWTNRLKL